MLLSPQVHVGLWKIVVYVAKMPAIVSAGTVSPMEKLSLSLQELNSMLPFLKE